MSDNEFFNDSNADPSFYNKDDLVISLRSRSTFLVGTVHQEVGNGYDTTV